MTQIVIDSQLSKNEIKLPIQTKYYALHDIFTCLCLFSGENCLLHAINEVVSNYTLNMVDCTVYTDRALLFHKALLAHGSSILTIQF